MAVFKAGFKVDFAVGSADDSCFGSILYTPEGILIKMVFHDNLWHIPMWRPPSNVPPRTALPSLCSAVKVNNYYRALDATSCDKRASKTITAIIAALHAEGHQRPLEQGFIGNRLHGTDVSEFIHARYGSLVKFLQDGTCREDFVVTIGNKGTCFIDYAPKLVLGSTSAGAAQTRLNPDTVLSVNCVEPVVVETTPFTVNEQRMVDER